ncbi:uncharacterized protein EV422DRAFT_190501 [Fimicolochytrium jonesii]|uniref:uncharacterized protein n=1 Tax=Fimicolochytrium jonesii TaxID=1396493 RepID=UPI0022FE13BA|nr:uncharacterized protein EV422DRAFT_190501 [Fimicolochytrium jonesii]KAI8818130.1 hypothetical protein EV422DRAFT_190501 [Fimicolochytrium jonesii]
MPIATPTPTPTPTPSSSATSEQTLHSLLTLNHTSHHIEYRGYLSNHLVHHLSALYFLGATSERLREVYDWHTELEGCTREEEEVGEGNWRRFLGLRRNYAGLLAHFTRELDRHPLDHVLATYLPVLIPGMHGSALHPLIHLGYACELDSQLIFAEALAYCTFSYLPVEKRDHNTLNGTSGDLGIEEVLERVRTDERLGEEKLFGKKGRNGQFQEKVADVVGKAGGVLGEYAGMWRQDPDPSRALNDLQKTATALLSTFKEVSTTSSHSATPKLDFFLLHLLTSTHAVLQILTHPALKSLHTSHPNLATSLIHNQYLSILVVYITQGRPVMTPDRVADRYRGVIPPGDAQGVWKGLRVSAVGTGDEHATKAVWTLWRWYEETKSEKGDDEEERRGYLLAAMAVREMVMGPEREGRDNWEYRGVGW